MLYVVQDDSKRLKFENQCTHQDLLLPNRWASTSLYLRVSGSNPGVLERFPLSKAYKRLSHLVISC